MLRRKMYDRLVQWKNREHKCLIVKGQRLVGKTYIINQFGKKEYESYVYVDLSKSDEVREIFDKSLDVAYIVKSIGLLFSVSIPEGSLIFFDEIQECPRARSALKQFTMDGRYDVVASGSLLGVDNANLKREGTLVPTGYEEHMTMFSLDFEEFLWAMDIPKEHIQLLRSHIRERKTMPTALLRKFVPLFRDFMVVGGMPESVQSYVSTNDYIKSFEILDNILGTCRNDINRYNTGANILKTMQCFDSIAPQLAKTNKKFTYSRIEGNQSRRAFDKYMENVLWIKYMGYGNFCSLLDSIDVPLRSHKVPDVFKIYLSDTGLLVRLYGNDTAKAVHSGITEFNNGSIAENVVAECLMKAGIEPLFYRKNSGPKKMELDFVTESNLGIAVIEVKSGKIRESPSLNKAINIYDIGRKIKFENENISVDEKGVEHYPLFAVAFIRDILPETEF